MTAGLLSFFTFLLGLLIGNRLAIGRDKRKEFNDAVMPVRGWLIKTQNKPTPYDRWPSEPEFDRFVHYLFPWRRAQFRRKLIEYQSLHKSMQMQDASGAMVYSDDKLIRKKLNELFVYTKLR